MFFLFSLDKEKLNLKIELAEKKSQVDTLKEELRKSEYKLTQVQMEKGQLDERLKGDEETREKVRE